MNTLRMVIMLALTWMFRGGTPAWAEEKTHQPVPLMSDLTKRPDEKLLFDGVSLKGWKVTQFEGRGRVELTNGIIYLQKGNDMTGITWTNEVPREGFEISLEAKRVEGDDFFCGLTFPVGASYCSFIVGGWGGIVVGLSSIDGDDAVHNETTVRMGFKEDHWYPIRLRVTPEKIEAWINKQKFVDFPRANHHFTIRLEVEESRPLGIATWRTSGALRNIRMQPVHP